MFSRFFSRFAEAFVVAAAAWIGLPDAFAQQTPSVEWTDRQPFNVWTAPQSPALKAEVTNPASAPWKGFVRVECFDLLTEKSKIAFLPVAVESQGKAEVSYLPGKALPYGVYRVRASAAVSQGEAPAPSVAGDKPRYIAYGPAKAARDLPDDWPLGIHIAFRDPAPLPGFKWYRHFSHWAENNPARGVYEWKKLDPVVEVVRKAGGRMVLTDDTTPAWAVAPERVDGVKWVKNATAYPPDDFNDLRAYLREIFKRYGDASGVLAAMEVWNEPNTQDRWKGTDAQMVEMARVFRETAHETAHPPLIFGIQVSAGLHGDYIKRLAEAGILDQVDGISGHWYEEMMAYDEATPISNLPRKVKAFEAILPEGKRIPVWNSESGIQAAPREESRLVSQDELNRRAEQDPGLDRSQPWIFNKKWRRVSERRAAASYIGGTLLLMSLGVEKTFAYTHYGVVMDDTPSLCWVAYAVLGDQIGRVNYRKIASVPATLEPAAAAENRAVALRLGGEEKPGLIVAWSYRIDDKVGRSKHWQPWQPALPVRIAVKARKVEITDLYGRTATRAKVSDGFVTVPVGEEPVYLREIR